MADIIKTLAAKNYRTLLEAVEANDWKCKHDDSALKISYGVNGDNLHMEFTITVIPEKQLVSLHSDLPCKFPPKMTAIGAMVICAANYSLSDGNFDFNVDNGSVSFKMTESYRGGILAIDAYKYLLNYSAWAVDKFYKPINDVINGKRHHKDVIEEFLK